MENPCKYNVKKQFLFVDGGKKETYTQIFKLVQFILQSIVISIVYLQGALNNQVWHFGKCCKTQTIAQEFLLACYIRKKLTRKDMNQCLNIAKSLQNYKQDNLIHLVQQGKSKREVVVYLVHNQCFKHNTSFFENIKEE
eukprot:TRINITY_DN86694_c1_g1_i2.p2 TRINITY_DN86694_c1_g1~~TRINITY_DN86694_c1_g1_i2.p2  ORF type:complete len:159 (-),score=0.64 TRINITY_DN86694_c1_g1_i2:221-637(-)